MMRPVVYVYIWFRNKKRRSYVPVDTRNWAWGRQHHTRERIPWYACQVPEMHIASEAPRLHLRHRCFRFRYQKAYSLRTYSIITQILYFGNCVLANQRIFWAFRDENPVCIEVVSEIVWQRSDDGTFDTMASKGRIPWRELEGKYVGRTQSGEKGCWSRHLFIQKGIL